MRRGVIDFLREGGCNVARGVLPGVCDNDVDRESMIDCEKEMDLRPPRLGVVDATVSLDNLTLLSLFSLDKWEMIRTKIAVAVSCAAILPD